MIALMNLSIGIMMISAVVPSGEILPVSVYIGYPIWGSLMVSWISYDINGSSITLFIRF